MNLYALPPADEIRPDLAGPIVTEGKIREEGPLDPGGAAKAGREGRAWPRKPANGRGMSRKT